MYAFHLLQFGLEPVDYGCRIDVALSKWLQVDLDASTIQCCICPIDPNERGQACDCRVLKNDARQFLLLERHGAEGYRLRSLRNALDNPDILRREQAFRYDNVEVDGKHQSCSRYQECRDFMANNPVQGTAVLRDESFEHALGPAVKASLLRFWFVAQQASTHHGRQGERDRGRDEDRNGERDGELAEQSSYDVPHQKQRDQNGN